MAGRPPLFWLSSACEGAGEQRKRNDQTEIVTGDDGYQCAVSLARKWQEAWKRVPKQYITAG
jgi:hypothetical protein